MGNSSSLTLMVCAVQVKMLVVLLFAIVQENFLERTLLIFPGGTQGRPWGRRPSRPSLATPRSTSRWVTPCQSIYTYRQKFQVWPPATQIFGIFRTSLGGTVPMVEAMTFHEGLEYCINKGFCYLEIGDSLLIINGMTTLLHKERLFVPQMRVTILVVMFLCVTRC